MKRSKGGKREDTFDEMFGPDSYNYRGYDEANDYDKEMEKPENSRWDDDEWKEYRKPFAQLEREVLS